MNIYETFPDFDDFDKSGQEELLSLFKNGSMITNSDLEKGIFGKGVDPFAGIRTSKSFEEISNEIAVSTPFKENSYWHSNFMYQQQKDRYLRDIYALMEKHCIEELYYAHDANDSSQGIVFHLTKKGKSLWAELQFSALLIDKETFIYKLIKDRLNLNVQAYTGGHFIAKVNQKWVVISSIKYNNLPFDKQYYVNKARQDNHTVSYEELKQIYEDFLSIKNKMPKCANSINYDALVKKLQGQVSKQFYSNVNMRIHIKQVNAYGNVSPGKDKTVQTNFNKPWDIRLDITLKPNGQVEIRHVASNNYMQQYVKKWKEEAKKRGLTVDIEALRKQCIKDFESQEIEKSFYQMFMQNAKALVDDNIVGYVEGVQVTQKIAKNVWAEGTINQSTWYSKNKEHTKWPQYCQFHPLVAGVEDGVIDEIVGIPMAIKGVYEIVTDEEKQKGLKAMFTKDGMANLYEGLKTEVKDTYNDPEKAEHFAGQTTVSVVTMMSGVGLFSKVKKLDEVVETATDLEKVIPNPTTTKLLEDARKVERHIDSDKIYRQLKEQINEDLFDDVVKDAAEEITSTGKKLSFKELQTFWKRGNDFNKKSKDLKWYENNEIWMTHPTKVYPKGHKYAGKPRRYRLDSWDKDSSMIVSRKATNLAEINQDTFIRYCKEISEKYPPGSKIANSEIGDKLFGKYYLEIPDTNLKFDRITEYKKIAEDLGVELIFKPE